MCTLRAIHLRQALFAQNVYRWLLCGAALFAVGFSLLGASSPAHAVARQPSGVPATTLAPRTAAALSPSSAEVTKVTLGDTSIDAPALWTATTGTVRGVLAWAGTDSAHHLNVMTTAIGTTFYNKITLPETSPVRPAVTRAPTGQVAVAWIGTDSAHTLNVLYGVYGARTKLTLWGETSNFSPALVSVNASTLVLAWTGTNASHSLNVLPISVGAGLSKGTKTVLAPFSSLTGPSLSYEPSRSEYLLGWSAMSPANRVAISSSTNAKTWSGATLLAETSFVAPSVLGIVGTYYTMPPQYLAWTGTNPARSLNVQYTRTFPAWPDSANTKVTLNESAYQSPALGFISGPGLIETAWTGTDAAHHLNVAVLTLMAPSPCALPGINPVPPTVIRQGTSGRKEVALTFDAGGAEGQPFSLLATLESAGVPSTWFFTGAWAQAHQAVIDRVVRDRIVIGDHTVDHPDLVSPARSDSFICYQLSLANQIIADRTGGIATRPYFRPPNGSYTTQVVNDAAGIGYDTVLWSIDTIDWQDTTTAVDILNRVKSQLGPGKIILMHVGSLHEPEALPQVIAYIRSQGYAIVSLKQVVAP